MILGVLATIILSFILGFIWVALYAHMHPSFTLTMGLYGGASIIESLTEPFLVRPILNFDYSVFAKSEFLSGFYKNFIKKFINIL